MRIRERIFRWYWRRYYQRHPLSPITAARFREVTKAWGTDDNYTSTVGSNRVVVISKRVGEGQ